MGAPGAVVGRKYAAPSLVGWRLEPSSAGSRVVQYPKGTLAGDLVVWVSHGFIRPAPPPGFTSVYESSADPNGYYKTVSTRISSGESWLYAYAEGYAGYNGFDCTILVFRGARGLFPSIGWTYANSGASVTVSSTGTGLGVLIASDRGMDSFPPIPGAAVTLTGTALYFTQTTGLFPEYVAGSLKSYSDTANVWGTSGLFFVVRPLDVPQGRRKIPQSAVEIPTGPWLVSPRRTHPKSGRLHPDTSSAQLDVSNPLTHRLQNLYVPAGTTMRDVLRPASAFTASAVTRIADVGGVGLSFDGSASSISGNTTDGHYNRGFTALVVCKPESFSDYNAIFGSGYSGWDLRFSGAGKLCLAHSGSTVITTGVRVLTAGNVYACLVSLGADNASLMYINGLLDTTDTITTTDFGDGTQPLVFGSTFTSGGAPTSFFDGTIYAAALWDRALTRAECAALTANPWQLFQQPARSRVIYQPPPAPYIITSKQPWRSQPTQAVELNPAWDDRVLSAYCFSAGNNYRDVVRGLRPTLYGDAFKTHTSVWSTGNSGSSVRFYLGTSYIQNAPLTIIFRARKASGSVAWSILRTDVSDWYGWYSEGNNFKAIQNNWGTYGAVTAASAATNMLTIAAGDSGSALKLFASDGSVATDTSMTTLSGISNNIVHVGGALRTIVDNLSATSMEMFAAYRRALSDAELLELSRNPWVLFVPRRRVLYFGSASAAPTNVEMAGLLESLLGSHTAGYIVTVNKGGELTGYVAHTAGAHVSVAVPASLTGSLLVSGGSQIAVSVPGTLTANASPSAGQYVTVQVTAESLSALSEILAGVSLGANVTQSGVLTAANGQVSASFQVSVNQLNAVLTGLATLSGQHQISVAVGGALLSQAALSAAHYTSATVTGQVFSAQGQLLGSIEIGGVVSTAGLLAAGVGSLSGGARVSVARAAGLQGDAGLAGGFAEGRVIADAVLTGSAALSGGFHTSVFVTGALTAYSGMAGELAHNVMIAADALIAQGLLQGSVRILGPAILTGIDPGVVDVTHTIGIVGRAHSLGAVSVTPAYVVVSITPADGVVSH